MAEVVLRESKEEEKEAKSFMEDVRISFPQVKAEINAERVGW